ncbi:PHA/PHB synthase family protein [Pelagibaculum spongiae]|uniref:Class I poly(R)-hydroxyalkanoic acid synthase n=1 Tax=Pelagibaculum spongiae TaxID=2080658 RepID=A0A2V1GV36_9GAMM|nr:class I poly(R)-hydroxyalkanoic acid synthase [Pelagibaculum spongiae]PVZ69551.1 class I poly(R)-hydroxyalkanoic acid synthase [Pelagibaculum spongiae]
MSAQTQHDSESLDEKADVVQIFDDIARRSQRIVKDFMDRQSVGGGEPDVMNIGGAFLDLTEQLIQDPSKLVNAQLEFWQNYAQLCHNMLFGMIGQQASPVVEPKKGDRRFKGKEWTEVALFDFIKQSYLLTSQFFQKSIHSVDGMDEKNHQKLEFITRQFVGAMSPTNFVTTNPDVLKRTIESRGENLVRGLDHMLQDLERGNGRLDIRMTDLDAFELGKNVAITEGSVVFQNDMMQLIQYKPTTKTVYQKPIMIIPPWINKYYILDLSPKNSYVQWLVNQGYTVFMISWVNPGAEHKDKTFDDYLTDGTLAAIDTIRQITNDQPVMATGYCLGGTLLSATAAWLKSKGQADKLESLTYLATLIDFSDPGELGVFIDEKQVASIESNAADDGYMNGRVMAGSFNMLRENDLIWSYFITNYLCGDTPFPFDLLYWNSDATNMPAKMHTWYLRKMYMENCFKDSEGVELAGVAIDVSTIKTPAYFVSTHDDHIAKWQSTYPGAKLHQGPVKFVLGGSGHIAGIVNPPVNNKYGFQTCDELPDSPDDWLENAQQNEGSWWTDWDIWASEKRGKKVPARIPGSGKFKALEAAPGSYVKRRI